MGRVKPSTMREGVKVKEGIPFFKWEMGKKYKVVFPSLAEEKDVFAYMEAVHQVTINGRFTKLRCVNADYQVSEASKLAVVRTDDNGELLKDTASGRVLNDGSCPLCELEYLYRQFVFHEVEKFKEANPDATDKEISAEYKALFQKKPVEGVSKRNKDGELKINTTKILLGVVYRLDEKNNYVLDKDGYPVYDIQVFDFSDTRYDKLHSAADNNKEYLSDTLKAHTDDFGLAWAEFVFDFPSRDEKAQSGKDLTIAVIPSGHSAVEKYNDLKNKVEVELGDGTKFEEIFENLPALRVRSIPELEKELQGKLQLFRETLTEGDREELDEKLSEDEKYISNEDAEKLLEEELSGGSSTFDKKEDAGEDAFLA
jgi:hypothetical protein